MDLISSIIFRIDIEYDPTAQSHLILEAGQSNGTMWSAHPNEKKIKHSNAKQAL